MTSPLTYLADAGLFATLAYLGTLLGHLLVRDETPFEDGPRPGRPRVVLIVAAAALAGLCVAARGTDIPALGLSAVLCVALAGVCYTDIRCGLVPDVLTLVPLAAILAGDALLHQWFVLIAVAVVGAPFGIAAMLSNGRGMGWGDVKLVALGAAVLGAQAALASFGLASLAAVAYALLRGRRGEPIAFAPYLVVAIASALALRGAA